MTAPLIVLFLLAAAALTAGAWASLAFRRDLRASRQRLAGASRVVETAFGAVEYAERGDGPALLVAHGSGGGFDQGLELAVPLAERGFRVIAMSRFGHLRTPLPADPSPAAQADAFASLMDALGIARAAMLGASAGALSALQFAIRHPERCTALVLMVPVAYKPPEAPASAPKLSPLAAKILMTLVGSDLVYWLACKLVPGMVIERVLATPGGVVRAASAGAKRQVDRVMRHILPISRRSRGILNDSRASLAAERYPLETIAAPTLLLSARDDRYGTFAIAEYTARQIPNARFVGYESGGHVMVGRQEEAMAEIAAFLESAGAATRPGPRR